MESKGIGEGGLIASLVNSLGATLANVDDAELLLTGIKMTSLFEPIQFLQEKIIYQYIQSGKWQLLKIIGSIDILGNPVGLFSGIGTGIVDLFNKPIKGFVKGPLEGGKGMIDGAGSLAKKTFAGTLNSVGKITGSLGTGLLSLTGD